jgi:hypothetical protein
MFSWGIFSQGIEKTTTSKATADRAPQAHEGASKATGAVNVVSQQSPPQGTLTNMGDPKLEEVSRAAPNGVRRKPRSTPVHQAAGAGLGRKEKSAGEERAVHVLPEVRR